MSSDIGEEVERWDGETLLTLKLENAFFNAWKDVVRFDLKLDFGFGVVGLLSSRVARSTLSSNASSYALGARGCSDAHSTEAGKERCLSFLKLEYDLALRSDPGVDKLRLDCIDRSSSSRDGTDSRDVDRWSEGPSSGISFGSYDFSSSSLSSRSMLKVGLLL